MLTNFLNLKGHETIINEDMASDLQDLGDVLVVEPQDFFVTVVFVLVVQGKLDSITLLQLNLSCATLNMTRDSLLTLWEYQ